MKNPKECFSIIQNQQFFVLNELVKPTCEDGSEPLTFYQERFSLFKFVIINKDRKAATANIPVSAMPGIFKKTECEFVKEQFKNLFPKENKPKDKGFVDKSGAAFTVRMTAGKLKGKTPVEAIMESQNNLTFLENQITWLQQNLARYPKNQIQIDAITEGLNLYESGKLASLDGEEVNVSSPVTIFETGMRPLIRRKDRNGNSFVYEISILFNPGLKNPIEILISNYYAPVVQKENGMLNVMASKAVNESRIRNSFSLSEDEWFYFQHIIEANMRTFEDIQGRDAYKKATDEVFKNRLAAKNEAS